MRMAAITIPAPVEIPPLSSCARGDVEVAGVSVGEGLGPAWARKAFCSVWGLSFAAFANAGAPVSSRSVMRTPMATFTGRV